MYSFVRYDLEWKCITFSDRQTSHSFFFLGHLQILADSFRPQRSHSISKDRTTIEPLRSRLAFRWSPQFSAQICCRLEVRMQRSLASWPFKPCRHSWKQRSQGLQIWNVCEIWGRHLVLEFQYSTDVYSIHVHV